MTVIFGKSAKVKWSDKAIDQQSADTGNIFINLLKYIFINTIITIQDTGMA